MPQRAPTATGAEGVQGRPPWRAPRLAVPPKQRQAPRVPMWFPPPTFRLCDPHPSSDPDPDPD